MSEQPMGEFLEIDWPGHITSHKFVREEPTDEIRRIADDRLQWWVCEKCNGRKLIKMIPGNTTGPESRLIQMRQPKGMTSVCSEADDG